MNIKINWPIYLLIAMIAVSGTLLATYSPKASAESYIALTKSNIDLKWQGQLDSAFDQHTRCMSCDQVTGKSNTQPVGIIAGYRTDGDWFIDGSVFVNQDAEMKGDVPGVHAVAHVDTWGATIMGGREIGYGFDLAIGMSRVCMDANVDA
jgi:hypothetical protein